MDPMVFLQSKREEERSLMQAIAAAARELQRQGDLERANQIAREISKLFGG